ncbi:MAG TPA: DUF262 domain-containing protein [Bradyrhizobium sp.]|jgi:hypothetical protein|uniref:DUF262 domain-containing protein n=1 Tax=Bradyrhizobium sp. TaxID=376 RepID=UPI002CE2E5B1|nr:DUF262 domain-containing protein [Bradyrhizobium sp.]HTB02319.1 DUF262 domain-containing protein [Bradyrhizobium sp.]
MARAITRFKVSSFDPKTLSWWRARKNKIDMDPPYQRRGHLWSDADKAYLIDSIINGFDVPKVYVADFTILNTDLNRKRLPYAIIDGKQRFEAIFDFFEGRVVLNEDFIFLENPSLKLGGLGYYDLTQKHGEIAELFDTYNLSVMSVTTNSKTLINELFIRLNRSKPLTGAEIRNAMAGPAPEVTRQMAKHQFFTDYVAFQVQRGQDLNAAMKLLLFEFAGKPQETKKSTLDAFVKAAAKQRSKLEVSARRAYVALDDLTNVFLPRDRLLASSGLLPVYYWFIQSLKSRQYPLVRDFLVQFEEARRANRQKAELDGLTRAVDRKLLEYDQLNRNTNDLTSHIRRIEILQERFARFKH